METPTQDPGDPKRDPIRRRRVRRRLTLVLLLAALCWVGPILQPVRIRVLSSRYFFEAHGVGQPGADGSLFGPDPPHGFRYHVGFWCLRVGPVVYRVGPQPE